MHLTDVVCEQVTPLDFEAVLASAVTLHPLATDAATGAATDLAPVAADRAGLKLALRASTALPLLAGPPVTIGRRRFFDAGLAEAVPFRTAIAQGATHVLVLRSRMEGQLESPPGRGDRAVARYLRHFSEPLASAFLDRPGRLARDDEHLAGTEADLSARPALLSLRPPPGTPRISRLDRDSGRVRAGVEAGRDAVLAALGGSPPGLRDREP